MLHNFFIALRILQSCSGFTILNYYNNRTLRLVDLLKYVSSPLNILCFFYKLRFQLHCTDPLNFTIDIMIAIDQTDIFHFSTNLDY